jgi:hypothetical protein
MTKHRIPPPTPAQMIAELDRRPLFEAQQLVNGWQKAFGAEVVKEAQAEVDRRWRKAMDHTEGKSNA